MKILYSILRIICGVVICLIIIGIYFSQPIITKSERVTRIVDKKRLEESVKYLSINCHPRNYFHTKNLNKASEYIFNHFKKAGARPFYQEFEVYKRNYRNVRCIFGKGKGRRLIIGAHYDSFEDTPGADDNASGVAGLIELAYLLGNEEFTAEIELVSYPLEEPPFFASKYMGSVFHANSLVADKIKVVGVIVLEMIGYYDDKFGSQLAPSPLFSLIYPKRANFITIVSNTKQRKFTKQVKKAMKGATDLKVYSLNAPINLPGVDFSDHRNYWPLDMNAVMITDTAPYRNKAYHKSDDTYERLDYASMSKTILGVYNFVKNYESHNK